MNEEKIKSLSTQELQGYADALRQQAKILPSFLTPSVQDTLAAIDNELSARRTKMFLIGGAVLAGIFFFTKRKRKR